MSREMEIYAPNVSKENLTGLLLLQLQEIGDKVDIAIIKPERKVFRGPELLITLLEEDPTLATALVARLFEVARSLGGTRFVFKGADDAQLRADANITTCNLIELSESVGKLEVKRIEIY